MTIKIKLTQKQSNFIERSLSSGVDKEEMLNGFAAANSFKKKPNHSLHGLCVMDLARALLIGYEIESEYKVGDWVARVDSETFYPKGAIRAVEVLSVRKGHGEVVRVMHGENEEWGTPISHLRHATPEEIRTEKERRLWESIGREVGDFRMGDSYQYKDGRIFAINHPDRLAWAKKAFRGNLNGFYPAESFMIFEEVEPNATTDN